MRTRTRLLLSIVGINAILVIALGIIAWSWFDSFMRTQAEESARSVGRVLAQGGFPLTPEVIRKMQDLTGYEFRVLPNPEPVRAGTVQVAEAGKIVEIDYRTTAYVATSRAVLIGTLGMMIIGSAVFSLMAWWLAAQVARPIEHLAGAARIIGTGNLDQPVAAVGSGELGQLAIELEQMRQRLQTLDAQHRQDERLATLGTFTATIAHEVRNPLSAVRLSVQMLAKRNGISSDDQTTQVIIEELDRLDLIVDELLGFSRGMQVTLSTCSLHEVAADTLRLLRRQADHAGVTLKQEGNAVVHADPARLRQLLMNLVLNAIQATQGREPAEVMISISNNGFAISDTGPGVDPQLRSTLFAPFSTGRTAGTGLGLHLARAIAEAHGATLHLDESYAPGARFVLAGLAPVSAEQA